MKYYVNRNAQDNGDHQVHAATCSFLPHERNRVYLGDFLNCQAAVMRAWKRYDQVNGCHFCSPTCHTR